MVSWKDKDNDNDGRADDFRTPRLDDGVAGAGPRSGWGRRLFGPASLGGGRFQVSGCSPGCLLVSLVVSLILTLVLNLVLNLVF